MYTKILVPLDGSKLSEGVLPYVRCLAKELKLPVELLQVVDPEVISTLAEPEHGRYFDSVMVGMKSDGANYLKRHAGSFTRPLPIECSVEVGRPADTIIEKASEDASTLVAMATHGRSGVGRWLLGSVADKVLHGTRNHLFLVRPSDESTTLPAESPLKTAIVPLDGSELAETVLPYVAALARAMKMEVLLVRVHSLLAEASLVEADMYTPAMGNMWEEIRTEAWEYLKSKEKELRGEGVEKIFHIVLEGHGAAAGEIIDFAKKTPDNLVAMCTHGRSGIGRWVLGSVTDRVVRYCGDPVLVIRARS